MDPSDAKTDTPISKLSDDPLISTSIISSHPRILRRNHLAIIVLLVLLLIQASWLFGSLYLLARMKPSTAPWPQLSYALPLFLLLGLPGLFTMIFVILSALVSKGRLDFDNEDRDRQRVVLIPITGLLMILFPLFYYIKFWKEPVYLLISAGIGVLQVLWFAGVMITEESAEKNILARIAVKLTHPLESAL